MNTVPSFRTWIPWPAEPTPGLYRLLLILILISTAHFSPTGAAVLAGQELVQGELDRLQGRLDQAITEMIGRGEAITAAWDRQGGDLDKDPVAAFGFLSTALTGEMNIADLPVGVQLFRGANRLAWAGGYLPSEAVGNPDPAAAPVFELQSLGLYHFLVLRGGLSGADDLQWTLDLPLATTVPLDPEERGLPVLLEPGVGLGLAIFPPDHGEAFAAGEDSAVGGSRQLIYHQGGKPVLQLRVTGPDELTLSRAADDRGHRRVGLTLFLVTLVAGFLLRWILARAHPHGLSLAWRTLYIGALLLILRWALAYGEIPSSLLPGSEFWGAKSFAMAGVGGILASPGDFLLSALAALLMLVLVLRPYLRPREGGEPTDQAVLDKGPVIRARFRSWRSLLLLPGLLGPILGVIAALLFGKLVFRNTTSDLLFLTHLTDLRVVGFNIALFLALTFILALFLTPAQSAWKRLHPGRNGRVLYGVLMLSILWLLAGGVAVLALLVLLPVIWDFRRAAHRLTGLLYHLFFIIIAVALLAQGAVEQAREQYLRSGLIDLTLVQDTRLAPWNTVLVERELLELAGSESVRKLLTGSGGFDSWSAQALWQATGLQKLGLQGSLEIFDGPSRQGVFNWGCREPETSSIRFRDQQEGRVDIRLEERQAGQALVGQLEIESEGEYLCTLVLTLLERGRDLSAVMASFPENSETVFGASPVPDRERAFLARLQDDDVTECSSPLLFREGPPRLPTQEGVWVRQELGSRTFRSHLLPGRGWFVGYEESNLLESLLELSQRLLIDILILGFLLLIDILLSRFTLVRRFLPPLISSRGLGFQHRLLGGFLLVALLPTILTGMIAGRQLRSQYDDASLRRSLERAFSAQRGLENMVRQDAQKLLSSEYVENFITRTNPDFTLRELGSLQQKQIMIFNAADSLIYDESTRDWGRSQVDSFLAVMPSDEVVYEQGHGKLYTGIMMEKEVVGRPYRVFYRMLLSHRTLARELLGDLAAVTGGDLSLYVDGTLLESSSPALQGLGYQPLMLAAGVVADLILADHPYRQELGRSGGLSYGQASVALRDATGATVAVLASLDFSGLVSRRAAEQRSVSLVLSMIALLVILGLALGGFIANRIFIPIRRLHLGTSRLASGDLSYRLSPLARDEIGDLVRSFNSMAGGLQETRVALEERQRFLEGVLENVASGVLILDLEDRIRSINGVARGLLGTGAENLEGRNLTDLEEFSGESQLRVGPLFNLLAENPPRLSRGGCQLTLERPGGNPVFRVVGSELATGRVVIFEDVTELIRSQKQAAWSEMARQVAHEIKNPLTPIKLSTQMLDRAWRDKRDNFDQIFRESVDTIFEQVEILRTRASEFSRFGHEQKLQLEPLDIDQVTREILEPYTGGELELIWGEDPSLLVLAAREALGKVLPNLVENAREAMGGRGRLDISCRRGEDQQVELLIRDHGPGIPEQTLHRLFEPYFSTKTSGTGLGLAISAQLVEKMGGRLTLENHPQGGAVARLTLRLAGEEGTGSGDRG
jgi:signal transduction histidine kinase/HAMP domain-containing protein